MEDQLQFYDNGFAGSQGFLEQAHAAHDAEVPVEASNRDEAPALLEEEEKDLFKIWCKDLPLLENFQDLGDPFAGVTTGDIEEASNLHIFTSTHERPATEADQEPATKRQRLDGAREGEAPHVLPATPAAAPEVVSSQGKKIVKAHGCLYCSESFGTNSALSRHERVHTGVKPFSCQDCGKCFTQKGNLQNHVKTHTGVKDHVCNEAGCGMAFSDPSNLKQHLEKTHGGSKAFCFICSKSLRANYELQRHFATPSHMQKAALGV